MIPMLFVPTLLRRLRRHKIIHREILVPHGRRLGVMQFDGSEDPVAVATVFNGVAVGPSSKINIFKSVLLV